MIEKLNKILQILIKNAVVEEYDTADGWHVVKRANGNVEVSAIKTVSITTTGLFTNGHYVGEITQNYPVRFSKIHSFSVSGNGVGFFIGGIAGNNSIRICATATGQGLTYNSPVSISVYGSIS